MSVPKSPLRRSTPPQDASLKPYGRREHCYFLSRGELRAIVGDETDHGYGVDQHSGVWFLASSADRRNIVAGGASILVFSHHRGTHPAIRRVENGVELTNVASRDNNYVSTRSVYRLAAPHYLDYELRARQELGSDSEAADRPMNWCCYMESPSVPGIHFLDGGRWRYHLDTVHGLASSILPKSDDRLVGAASTSTDGRWDGTRSFDASESGYQIRLSVLFRGHPGHDLRGDDRHASGFALLHVSIRRRGRYRPRE